MKTWVVFDKLPDDGRDQEIVHLREPHGMIGRYRRSQFVSGWGCEHTYNDDEILACGDKIWEVYDELPAWEPANGRMILRLRNGFGGAVYQLHELVGGSWMAVGLPVPRYALEMAAELHDEYRRRHPSLITDIAASVIPADKLVGQAGIVQIDKIKLADPTIFTSMHVASSITAGTATASIAMPPSGKLLVGADSLDLKPGEEATIRVMGMDGGKVEFVTRVAEHISLTIDTTQYQAEIRKQLDEMLLTDSRTALYSPTHQSGKTQMAVNQIAAARLNAPEDPLSDSLLAANGLPGRPATERDEDAIAKAAKVHEERPKRIDEMQLEDFQAAFARGLKKAREI